MAKIIVTGGLGFIGSHTTVELIDQGYEVVVVDDLSNSTIETLERIESITGVKPIFEQFDLRDKSKVSELFKKHSDQQGVIHFAASKAVGESVEKPLLYYENNLNSLIYILQELSASENKNFIFSSSCTVYGEAEILPITEDSPVALAESPYGNTKQIGEEIIRDICKTSDEFNAIALRYFNPIGAHASGNLGELPLGIPQNLIPYITQTAIGLREKLLVFGNDYNTIDGTGVRDYIHVVDLAKAHIVALKRLIDNKNKSNYEIFNLGTGKGNSVLEVIQAFEKVSNVKLNYEITDRRSGDIESAYADTKKANEELGWKAEMSLEDALLHSWQWELNLRQNN
ncbi:MAG: UDP-glucose 4-epimerase GalE [Flavobacteriaceae bacterium]|nr:UDP-glucose 4-epimerase GalE [Flavobacteriaceae bacterium]